MIMVIGLHREGHLMWGWCRFAFRGAARSGRFAARAAAFGADPIEKYACGFIRRVLGHELARERTLKN